MSFCCVLCDRNFNSDKALQQHKKYSPAHNFNCTICNRHFSSDTALVQHKRDAPVHTQSLEHPATLAMPPKKRKPTTTQKPSIKPEASTKPKATTKPKLSTKPKPTKNWSIYPSLHDDVSDLLYEANLFFNFYEKDDDNGCIDYHDTNIRGRFTCSNPACPAVWTSGQVAITIREYSDSRYNARVYYQSCKRCQTTSEPQLDHSYAERVAYRLKKWAGVQVERPPYSKQSNGPHRKDLCEGCKQGRCSSV